MDLLTMLESGVIERSAGPVEATVGSEVVLMVLATGECIGLGETGSDVWRLLASPTRFAPLVESLRELYEAPPGVIEQDVLALLEEMQAKGLVAIRPAA